MVFDIRRRFFYSKIFDKLIAKKARWRGRAVALLMSALFVVQMLVPLPWGFAESRSEQPNENELWVHPRIEFNGTNIYNGVSIPLSAKMNAVYEFTINTGQFPIEVSLPDVLKAVTGEYSSVAFDVYGELVSGVKVFVDRNGVIEVHYEQDVINDEDDENDYGATDYDEEDEAEDCCESCADDIGSDEPDEADYSEEPDENSEESSGYTDENDEIPDEDQASEALEDATSGSDEPVDNDADEVDNDSISMFPNIGSPTASAFYIGTTGEQITIKFEIPCYFDIDKLPPMPEPVFDEETSVWDEPDPWLVDVFHTEIIDEKHVGEFVTVEILPGEFELFISAMDDVVFDVGTVFRAFAPPGFIALTARVNWNDGDWANRPYKDTVDDFPLTIMIEIPGVISPARAFTVEDLLDWGWAAGDSDTDKEDDAEERLAERTSSSLTVGNNQHWAFVYTGLPQSIAPMIEEIDPETDQAVIDPETGLPVLIPGEHITIIYSFVMDDEKEIEKNYIITPLDDPETGFLCTRKEVFIVYKEWKDNNNTYKTRPDSFSEVYENMNFNRTHGLLLDDLGTLADPDEDFIPNVNVAAAIAPAAPVPHGITAGDTNVWVITVTDIPMFAADGTPFHYSLTETPIDVEGDERWDSDTVRYEPTYVNFGAYTDDDKRGLNGGIIINRLTDEVPFTATKNWFDDNAGESARPPGGKLLLYRYANTSGMTFRTASPVPGMEVDVARTNFDIGKAFEDLDVYKVLYPNGFPRFNTEGQEYVYFVKELYSGGSGEYRGFAVYPDEGANLLPSAYTDRNQPGILFNGGDLNNIRVGAANVSVTKVWEAAARQSMNADVEVLIERRLVGNNSLGREPSAYLPVPGSDFKDPDDPDNPDFTMNPTDTPGVFTLKGFRAEVMTLTQAFGLPKYDPLGVLYEYRVTEVAATINEDRQTPDDTSRRLLFTDGFQYEMKREVSQSGGNTTLTNVLIGETEVRIRKIWNGAEPQDASFILRGSGARIYPTDGRIGSISIERVAADGRRTVVRPSSSQTDFTIPASNTWHRATRNAPDAPEGDWLVISGLPRYDARGREIEYTVREDPIPSGFHNTFSFSYYNRMDDGLRVGVVESTFVNTPAELGGRYIRVTKEWADDGDLACRDTVEMGLYYIGPCGTQNEHVRTLGLTRGADWTGLMELTHVVAVMTKDDVTGDLVPVMVPDENTGELVPLRMIDHNYNNYIVKELRILRGSPYPEVDYFNPLTPESFKNAYGDQLGEITTSAHHYDVFAKADFTKGSSLTVGNNGYIAGTVDGEYDEHEYYRTSYTFKNVRRGYVVIDITKNWRDDSYHRVHVPQRVEIHIERRLNYPDAYGNYVWRSLNHDDNGNEITGAFDGIVHLQYGVPGLGLTWNSTSDPKFPGLTLPKYSPNGVLYVYRVNERYVHVMPDNSTYEFNPRETIPVSGGYTLGDPNNHYHRYSVHQTENYNYGDHISAPLRNDVYTYTITNQRQESVNFEVYKLWHDVVRNVGVPGVDFSESSEVQLRPDMFLTLYSQYADSSKDSGRSDAVAMTAFVRNFWSTSGVYNTYYWKCVYDALPRYDSNGREIFYSVREVMPNRALSDYKTFYYDTDIGVSPVQVDDLDGIARNRITSIPIYDVPLTGVTDVTAIGRVESGGIIVNRRQDDRELSGNKVWLNVPGDTPPGGYPEITLSLMHRLDHRDDDDWEYLKPLFPDQTLSGRQTAFNFVSSTVGTPLPRYNSYGVQILYRAKEDDTAPGYHSPRYNDYIMEVTNEYNVSVLTAETVRVSIEKNWNYAPFTEAQIAALDPTATIELWRVMTDGTGDFWKGDGSDTSVIGGSDIPDTAIKVGEITIKYSERDQIHTFGADNLVRSNLVRFDLPVEELPLAREGKLLRIGYNGQPYRYFLRESLDGYTFTAGLPEYTQPRGTPAVADFHYKLANNRYDGSSSDIRLSSLVHLHGTKNWVDSEDIFGTRPNGGNLYESGDTHSVNPSVTLRVFRAISADLPGTVTPRTILPNTFLDITNSVDIVWTRVNSYQWSYVVNAKETQPTAVGTATGLFRYSLTGAEFVYFVEEVSVNHHYQTPVLTYGAAIPPAMIGTGLVPPVLPADAGNLRIMATARGAEKVASFSNTMYPATVPVTKVWQTQTTAGPLPMSLANPSEIEMMIPPGITFKVQFREINTDTDDTTNWTDFNIPGTGTPYTIERNREEILNALRPAGSAGSNEMTLTFNSPLLPRYGGASNILRQYRLVETHIGAEPVEVRSDDSVGGGGFTVTSTDSSVTNMVETIPLQITKTWIDDNNRDGMRPASITFRITRDNDLRQVMDVVMTTTDNTTLLPVYVPKFRADGVTLSTYTVEELFGDDVTRGIYSMQGTNPVAATPFTLHPDTPGGYTYTFTNNYGYITKDLTVRKTWYDQTYLDALGGPGVAELRPAENQQIWLTIQRRDGPAGTWENIAENDPLVPFGFEPTVMLDSTALTGIPTGSWNHTWEDLVMRHSGTGRYQYRVVETDEDGNEASPVGYTAEYRRGGTVTYYQNPDSVYVTETDVANGIDVQNKLNTINLDVTKNWDGFAGDFARRGAVVIRLYYRLEGDTTWIATTGPGATHTFPAAATSWTHRFTGLPERNNAGVPYQYTVREVSIGGVLVPGNMPLSWLSSVVDPAEGSGGNPALPPYTTTNTPTNIAVRNILQTRNDITVTKEWVDSYNQDGIRPASVQVYLIKDMGRGVAAGEISVPVTLNAGNNWTHTFRNLPRYNAEGIESTYHVREVPLTATPSYSPAVYRVGPDPDAQFGFGNGTGTALNQRVSAQIENLDNTELATEVTVRNSYTPRLMSLTAEKLWSDQLNTFGTQPSSIRLQLYVTTNPDGMTSRAPVGSPVTVSPSATPVTWSYTWTDLPVRENPTGLTDPPGMSNILYYSVAELGSGTDTVPGYSPGYSYRPVSSGGVGTSGRGIRGNINDADNTVHFVDITNTLDTVNITVNKVWRDAAGVLLHTGINQFAQTAAVDVRLYYRLAGSGDTGWTSTGFTHQLTSDNQWTRTFENLPKQNSSGTAYEYTVQEIRVGNVNTAAGVFPLSYQSGTDIVDAMVNPAAGITVTNTLQTRGDITVQKFWDDRNNQDGIRPTSVQIYLIKDMNLGVAAGEIISSVVTLNAANSWTHTFTNLPRYNAAGGESTYHVMEVPLNTALGYSLADYRVGTATEFTYLTGTGTTAAAGQPVSAPVPLDLANPALPTVVIVRNSYVPREMSLTATKFWSDQLNTFGTQPASISLQLRVTTDATGQTGWDNVGVPVTVPASGSTTWTYTWSELPIMRNPTYSVTPPGTGVALYYSVVELAADGTSPVHGYSAGYTYRAANGSGGTATGNGIRGNINDANNTVYYVDITNTLDTVDVTVNKVWDDLVTTGTNPFAVRDEVEVRLYYRVGPAGTLTVAPTSTTDGNTRILNEGNNWTAAFENLPGSNSAGVQYRYTVKEIRIGNTVLDGVNPPEYPFSYSSTSSETVVPSGSGVPTPITVTNTLQTRNDITVQKNWLDSYNRDGIRPESVRVYLIKNMGITGQEISVPVILSEANGWKDTFTNLPRYNAAGVENTYHVMEEPLDVVPSYNPVVYRVSPATGFSNFDGVGTVANGKLVSAPVANMAGSEDATVVTVQNSYEPKVMTITATKVWVDQDNIYGFQPDEVQLQLFVTDGTGPPTPVEGFTDPVAVNEGTSWHTTWSDLPIMSNTRPLTYTVVELDMYGNAAPFTGYLPPAIVYSGGYSSADGIVGDIENPTPPDGYRAVVTNTLDTVDITVRKEWGDFGDLYRLRPERLEFTLQRRLAASPPNTPLPFEDVEDSYGNPITDELISSRRAPLPTDPLALDEEEIVFSGLPRFNLSGVPWEYRVLETGTDGAGITTPFSPDPVDPTKGTIGDPNVSHYRFSSSTEPVSDGFLTTVYNDVVMEKIAISGTKTWVDESNKYGFRPDEQDFKLNLFYLAEYSTAQAYWRPIDERDYTVEWVNTNSNVWSYTIRGNGLTKYEPGTDILRAFAVQEELPNPLQNFYIMTVNPPNPPISPTLPANSSVGSRVTGAYRNGYIENAGFTNSLPTATTSLRVNKDTDFGRIAPDSRAPVFTFKVYFAANIPADPINGTLLMNHDYFVYTRYDEHGNAANLPPVKHSIDDDGNIVIAAGQSFVLEDLPQGLNFYIVEEDHAEFELEEIYIVSGKTDWSLDVGLTVVNVKNTAIREVSIVNDTPNEGIRTPTNLTNAGGKVSVEHIFGQNHAPDKTDGDEGRDKLAVLWEPEGYWAIGDYFTIIYTDFSETEKSFTVRDYLSDLNPPNPDGSPSPTPLGNLLHLASCEDGLRRFAEADAHIYLTPSGAVKLVLSEHVRDMPRSVRVVVHFLPTLAVNNVTIGEGNEKIGGLVRVIDGGDYSSCSDGAPAFDGTPYVSTSVRGVAKPGFTTDLSHILVRNLLDGFDCDTVLIVPERDGSFTAQLRTEIAGVEEIVVKTGRIIPGSITVVFDGIPVPLQVDLRFIPITESNTNNPYNPSDTDDPDDADDPDNPDRNNIADDPNVQGGNGGADNRNVQGGNGGLPRTGVESMLWVLVLGMVTSIVATAAVLIVIRRQSIKDRC